MKQVQSGLGEKGVEQEDDKAGWVDQVLVEGSYWQHQSVLYPNPLPRSDPPAWINAGFHQ